ncbi:MAG: orotidine-5'-phosphate decarboxylase [Patescibacteria group bacterium]
MQLPWLDPDEQGAVVQALVGHGLIKWSNQRNLPLKSGGFTDVYINLRDARNHPPMIGLISDLYASALRRLHVDRFLEIPDSVSCFAGTISQMTGMPYITVREAPKVGRVAKAQTIGSALPGTRAAIIDDVITDGASKVIPYQVAVGMGLDVRSLVVLVDRQQGWQKHLADLGIDLEVWPGMTLHDVRRLLITSGLMERCDPNLEARNPIIVALDGKSWEEILPIIDPLRTTGCIFKVNDLLIAEGSDRLLPNLMTYGRVMADVKGHDIPNTLENISRKLRKCPPWAITVHASGGQEMIAKTVKIFEGTATKVLAVTVLTSIDQTTCEEIYRRMPIDQVMALAEIANRAGAHGIVCSPEETQALKAKYPNATIVNPGIRSEGTSADDQKRISTPGGAMASGASNLVMGRQILNAPDPVAEVMRVLNQELNIH